MKAHSEAAGKAEYVPLLFPLSLDAFYLWLVNASRIRRRVERICDGSTDARERAAWYLSVRRRVVDAGESRGGFRGLSPAAATRNLRAAFAPAPIIVDAVRLLRGCL